MNAMTQKYGGMIIPRIAHHLDHQGLRQRHIVLFFPTQVTDRNTIAVWSKRSGSTRVTMKEYHDSKPVHATNLERFKFKPETVDFVISDYLKGEGLPDMTFITCEKDTKFMQQARWMKV